MTKTNFAHVTDPTLRARLEAGAKRGAFQGWIGDYVVYQRDGTTHGYHKDNNGAQPDYAGSERGLHSGRW